MLRVKSENSSLATLKPPWLEPWSPPHSFNPSQPPLIPAPFPIGNIPLFALARQCNSVSFSAIAAAAAAAASFPAAIHTSITIPVITKTLRFFARLLLASPGRYALWRT